MANENLSIGFFCSEDFFTLRDSEAFIAELIDELENLVE